MAHRWYMKSGLTGGESGDVDEMDGNGLYDGDRVIVSDSGVVFFFTLNADSGESLSSPDYIPPVTNPGNKCWEREPAYEALRLPYAVCSSGRPATTPSAAGAKGIAIGDGADIDSDSDYGFCAGGLDNAIINADYATLIGGRDGAVKSDYATIVGGRENETLNAVALYSRIVGGYKAGAWLYGQDAWASGQYSAPTGCRQQSLGLLMRAKTTDATETELLLGDGTSRAELYPKSSWRFEIKLLAAQYAGSSGTIGDTAFWSIIGGVKQGLADANTALVGTPSGTGTPGANDRDAAAAAWSVAVTADTTNGSLKITGTGEADKSILWLAEIRFIETYYPNAA